MNLKEWAASIGIAYITARRQYAAGTLPVPTYRIGRLIMVGEPVTGTPARAGQTVVYAGVSSADQKPDLDRQVARVTVWATGQKLGVDRVVTEVGSALNGHRKKFLALLRDPTVTAIVVEHRDRFARAARQDYQPCAHSSALRGNSDRHPAGTCAVERVQPRRSPGQRPSGAQPPDRASCAAANRRCRRSRRPG
ncbi:IS607 family transposase [Micromonospora taraxaci]|uniref:IS607 family transposase n=1 Tax=Micromonospora taraxaci TaxID=1316803 RepID=UPI0033A29B23